jgi:hypothetical protein
VTPAAASVVARAQLARDRPEPRWGGPPDAAATRRTWWLEQWPEGAPHLLDLRSLRGRRS